MRWRAVSTRAGGRAPFFQVLFALQDNRPLVLGLDGLDTRFVRPPDAGLPAELLTEVWPGEDDAVVRVNWRGDVVSGHDAQALVDTFARSLQQL